MPSLEKLISLKAIPSDTVLIDEQDTITLSEYKAIGKLGLPSAKCMIIENADWIAYNALKNVYYSGNSKNQVGKYLPDKMSFIIQTLKNNKLKTTLFQNFKKGEDIKMDNKIGNLSDISFDDLGGGTPSLNVDLSDLDATMGLSEDVQPMHAFDDRAKDAHASKGAKGKASNAELLKNLITSDLSESTMTEQTELNVFNRTYGKLMGYITQNDAMIKFGTSSKLVMDPATKKPMIKSTAAQDIKERAARGEQVDPAYVEKETTLTCRQTAPGKILGGVIAIPEGGYYTISEVNQGQIIKPEKDKTDLKYVLFDKDSLSQIIAHLFGAEIEESSETFGAYAGKVRIDPKVVSKKNRETGAQEQYLKINLKPTGQGRKVITPNSYFPLKTFKTINIGQQLTAEQSHILAKSSFQHIFQATKAKQPKIDILKAEDRKKISRTADGNYESVFFTPDMSKREALKIRPYYSKSKEDFLTDIEIPVKEEVKTADGTKTVIKYVAYDVLRDLTTAEAQSNNSLALAKSGAKFSVFYNAVGGEQTINVESLRELKPKRGGSKSNEDIVDVGTIRKLLNAAMDGTNTSFQVEKGAALSRQAIDEKITQSRFVK